jgi:photosystem II stability/assembly factor-like uncharacterized protein
MRILKYWLIVLLMPFIVSSHNLFSQDFQYYLELFSKCNYDSIELNADRFWNKINSKDRKSNNNYKSYLRWKSFMKPRVGSNVDLEDYARAIYKYNCEFSKEKLKSSLESDIQFEYLGPKGIPWTPDFGSPGSTGKGWINRLIVFKNDTSHIIVGTHNAGLWETNNGGDSWQHITQGYPLITGINSIAVNPSDSDEYYILTEVVIGGSHLVYSNGIFKSANGGISWDAVPVVINDLEFYPTAQSEKTPRKLIINPSDSSVLFLLTKEYIIKSIDAGNSWEIKYSGTNSNLWDIEFDTYSTNIIYAAGSVILKSIDSGTSWDSITYNVSGLNSLSKTIIGLHENYPGKVWFFYDPSTTNDRKYLVKYSGGSYTNLYNAVISGEWTMNCTISPNSENEVYLGGRTFYKYETYPTARFKVISSQALDDSSKIYGPGKWLHADVRDIAIIDDGSNDELFVAHDGGVSWGIDNGICHDAPYEYYCWSQLSDDGTDGLYVTEFYGLAGVESDVDLLIGGTQDLSVFVYDNGVWRHSCDGDGGKTVIDYMDTDYSYIISSFNDYLYRLKNRGTSYDTTLVSLINGYLWNPIILNPVNSNTLFFGHSNLIKITNIKSTSWIVNNITPVNMQGSISAIGISKADTNTIYTSSTKIPWSSNYTDSLMWRTTNGGSTWIPINFSSSIRNIFGWSFVTDIIVNPDDEYELWICFGNSNCGSNKVYHSVNGGTDWSVLDDGYPENIPAHCIEYDEISKLLYVGTDVGFYFWDTENPSSWSKLDNNLNKIISEIVINKTCGKLRIATYGNGIWETDLPLCYELDSDQSITSNQTWSDIKTVCSNTIIQNGATLTVSGCAYLSYSVKITVKNGSTLKVTAGLIKNADIIVESGGTLIIENNGKLILDTDDKVSIEVGGILNYTYGSIEPES